MAEQAERAADREQADAGPGLDGIGPFAFDPIQSEIDALTRARIAQGESGLVIAPTGFGKGVLISSAVRHVQESAPPRADGATPRSLLVVPSLDLVGQTVDRLYGAGVIADADRNRIGVMCQASKRPDWPGDSGGKVRLSSGAEIVIATQNKVRDLGGTDEGRALLKDFDGILFDEAHRSVADGIGSTLRETGKPMIGWTATPFREDDRDVLAMFGGDDAIIRMVTRQEAIDAGRVVPGRIVANGREAFREIVGREASWDIDRSIETGIANGQSIDQASLTAMGRFFKDEATPDEKAIGGRLVEGTVEMWKRYASDRVTIVHAENVNHARALFDGFAGERLGGRHVRAASIDGEQVRIAEGGNVEVFDGAEAARKRQEVLTDARAGKYDVLTNCQVFREGIDIPRASASINACMNKGLGPFIQGVAGRGARSFTDPETGAVKQDHLIIDLGNTTARLANMDPRFRAGDVDMQGVAATSIPPQFLEEALATLDGDPEALREMAANYVADTESRHADEAARDSARSGVLPDTPAAEGIEVLRELNHRGESDELGSGERIFCPHTSPKANGSRLGSGTVLGALSRDNDGDPQRYAVYFDRYGLYSMPGDAVMTIGDARRDPGARMSQEDRTQRRWAAQGRLPDSIRDVLDEYAEPWRQSEHDGIAPGSRVYSFGMRYKDNFDKVGTGIFLHQDRDGKAVIRTDDGFLYSSLRRGVLLEERARAEGLVAETQDGHRFEMTPGGIGCKSGVRKRDSRGNPMFEPGEAVHVDSRADDGRPRLQGAGIVLDDSLRHGDRLDGAVMAYDVELDDGTRGRVSPGALTPLAERQREDRNQEARQAQEEQVAETTAAPAPAPEASSATQADGDGATEAAGSGAAKAPAPSAGTATAEASDTIGLETLGAGYSAERVAAYRAEREQWRDESSGAGRKPTDRQLRTGEVAWEEVGAETRVTGAIRLDARGNAYGAAGMVLPARRVAAATNQGQAGSGYIAVSVIQNGPAQAAAVQTLEEAEHFMRQQGVAPTTPAEARRTSRMHNKAPSDASLAARSSAISEHRGASSVLGQRQPNQALVSAEITLARNWLAVSGAMASEVREGAESTRLRRWQERVRGGAVAADPDNSLKAGDERAAAGRIAARAQGRQVFIIGDQGHQPHRRLVEELRRSGTRAVLLSQDELRGHDGAAAVALKRGAERGEVAFAGGRKVVDRTLQAALTRRPGNWDPGNDARARQAAPAGPARRRGAAEAEA